MSDAESAEPTQITAAGGTIPVPTRDDVTSALRRVARVEPPVDPGGHAGGTTDQPADSSAEAAAS